ncbi:feruloyl esterase B precursor [Fistulina hepatica ATCC 64428]|uniref:Carboxylic ester hydrolase n=1 Tax=Fistulina hepatica ATCC 64428 TaxID=1128425 RepID=A0A0D7ASY6_9AGAR|nr:feruloyl esterase B precursor [Fistulina hepatica ATCC 64428]
MRFYNLLFPLLLVGTAMALNCSVSAISAVLPSNVSVSWAYSMAEGSTFDVPLGDTGFPTSPTNLSACCAVAVEVPAPGNTTYNFGMFLPDNWNGRFLTAGNAGFAGGINWLSMGDGLGYGFAVMSTDTGHNSTAEDASWAYEESEKMVNWGYRALHGSIVLAKQLTEGYYGESISYSYYRGCSTGGRQGLKEAEMFPDDFDGVVVGAPAWWTKHLQLWNMMVGLYNEPVNSSHYVDPSLFSVLGDEMLKQCDPQDGVIDNIIMDPIGCNFRPETLLCTANTTNTSSCFTGPQLDTVYHWYNDWVEANQTFIFPHFQPGSEWQWDTSIGLLNSDVPSPLGTDYVQYMLGLGPDWSWEEWNPDLIALSDELNPGNATADDFDISPFYEKGGKLIHYHGLSDGSIATGSSIYFYDHVLRALTPQGIDLDDFYRFFLIPGMGHCAVTSTTMDAPWYIAGDGQAAELGTGVHSVPGFSDAKHDVLLAMLAWVENGTAPDSIIATIYVNDTTHDEVLRQRPLCVYPDQAFYNGTGDVNSTESWTCKSLY